MEYTAGTTFDSYEADYKTKDAVERNFEIIGEAPSRIPDDFKKLHPNVEWRIIKDFRNSIILIAVQILYIYSVKKLKKC